MKEKREYFSGETLEQAVMTAARHYGMEPEEVDYEAVEKRHGFLRVRRRVVIQVDPARPQRLAREPQEEPGSPVAEVPEAIEAVEPTEEDDEFLVADEVPEEVPVRSPFGRKGELDASAMDYRNEIQGPRRRRPPRRRESRGPSERGRRNAPRMPQKTMKPLQERFPPASGDVAEAAQAALEELLVLGDLQLAAVVLQGEEQLEVDLSGPDSERVTANEGRVLLAVQHLAPRLIQARVGTRVACRVDCGNFQELREDSLRDLAQRIATEVRRFHRPRTLRSMNPADRRVVHVALAEDPEVSTESSGEGYYKRITVRPA